MKTLGSTYKEHFPEAQLVVLARWPGKTTGCQVHCGPKELSAVLDRNVSYDLLEKFRNLSSSAGHPPISEVLLMVEQEIFA